MTEQEFYNEIMRDGLEEQAAFEAECRRVNSRIMNAVRSQIGAGFAADLLTLIGKETGYDKYRLVRSPGGKYQQETDSGCITGFWVYQTGNADYGFSGECWVKLKDSLFLQFHFAGE